MLRPFAEAGHWKTSLKQLHVDGINLWRDNDDVDLPCYPGNLEVLKCGFLYDHQNDAKSTIFQLMYHANKFIYPGAVGHCGKLSTRTVHYYCAMLLKHTAFCRVYSRAAYCSHIVHWGEFNLYVCARNRTEILEMLKTGWAFDSGVERLFSGYYQCEELVLAVTYHFLCLGRFRELLEHETGHLAIPHFLETLQKSCAGGKHHDRFSPNLLFSLLRENLVEITRLVLENGKMAANR